MLKKIKKASWKIMKIHLSFSIFFAILYIALSLIYSQEFLLADIKGKFTALAEETVAITAKVLGPPEKPLVSGSAVCSNGHLSVDLDWPDDEGSYSFNIEKDGLILVNGLADSQYKDELVETGQIYSYIVTAFGSMNPGNVVSDTVAVAMPDECEVILPDLVVNIVTLAGKNVLNYEGVPAITSRRPIFTGTTNITNADIPILIYESAAISAQNTDNANGYWSGEAPVDVNLGVHNVQIIATQTTANANGYWSWEAPVDLNLGAHNVQIIATDPADISRKVSDDLKFKIVKVDNEKNNNNEKNKEISVINSNSQQISEENTAESEETFQEEKKEIPLSFVLDLDRDEVFQGKDLETSIYINKLDTDYEGAEVILRYSVFDEKGENKISFLENSSLNLGRKIDKKINIPGYFKNGRYQIKVEIIFDKYNISRDVFFNLLERPVLKLGGGIIMTYSEILSNIGSIASLLILLLLLWLILFLIERSLYLHALRHITEINLRKIGMFGSKRKGANR